MQYGKFKLYASINRLRNYMISNLGIGNLFASVLICLLLKTKSESRYRNVATYKTIICLYAVMLNVRTNSLKHHTLFIARNKFQTENKEVDVKAVLS